MDPVIYVMRLERIYSDRSGRRWTESKKSGRMIYVDVNTDCSQHVVAGYQLARCRGNTLKHILWDLFVGWSIYKRCWLDSSVVYGVSHGHGKMQYHPVMTTSYFSKVVGVPLAGSEAKRCTVHASITDILISASVQYRQRIFLPLVSSSPRLPVSFPSILVFMANSSNSFVPARSLVSFALVMSFDPPDI